MERFARRAAEALNHVLETPVTATDLETPPDAKLGDFAFPCFKLSKALRLAPPMIAQDLAKKLQALPAEKRNGLDVAAVGPYVNFTAPPAEALRELLPEILAGEKNGNYGAWTGEKRGTWLIEFSSPNVAKPFMIYHFRPTGLGACLDRVGRYRGFNMVSINHIGDWGTQFGKLYVAFELYGDTLPADPKINDLVQIYVKFHEAQATDPTLETRAREAFKKLEQRDPTVVANWEKCIAISMQEFDALYAKLDVKFDHIWGESYYEDQLRPLLEELKENGAIVPSEGAWIANPKDEKGRELPPTILEKSDGSTIYATRDVAALLYRWKKFHFDRMTYVVGGEQKLHFQQVFGIVRELGNDWVSRCEHIPTGLYRFKDAKMSTRKGNFVTLQDVWDLARERVVDLMRVRMQERDHLREFTAAELDDITEKVAIAAIVFHDLHSDPSREVEFDVERIVDFEGETGPYLQYAHTRCLSILRKAAEQNFAAPAFSASLVSRLTTTEEIQLVKMLGHFPLQLERTISSGKASALAHYLIDVTKTFGAFYRECHVLGVDAELTRARLMLVESTRRILAQGLRMIGIPLPERM